MECELGSIFMQGYIFILCPIFRQGYIFILGSNSGLSLRIFRHSYCGRSRLYLHTRLYLYSRLYLYIRLYLYSRLYLYTRLYLYSRRYLYTRLYLYSRRYLYTRLYLYTRFYLYPKTSENLFCHNILHLQLHFVTSCKITYSAEKSL